MDSNPMVSSLLNKLANYTNLSQGVVEHEEDEDSRRREAKVPPRCPAACTCRLVPAHADRWPQAAPAVSSQDALSVALSVTADQPFFLQVPVTFAPLGLSRHLEHGLHLGVVRLCPPT